MIYIYRYRYRIDSVHFCPALHPSSLPWHGCPVSRGCHQAATSPRLGSPRRRWNIFCWSKHVKRVSKESPFCWLPALHPRASQDIQGTIHMSDGMELVKSKQCLLVLASGFSQERVDQKLSEAVTIDVTNWWPLMLTGARACMATSCQCACSPVQGCKWLPGNLRWHQSPPNILPWPARTRRSWTCLGTKMYTKWASEPAKTWNREWPIW